jgi:hypothetical protein
VELFLIELKVLERGGAFGPVPGIGQQYTAHIPEDCANGWQSRPPSGASQKV